MLGGVRITNTFSTLRITFSANWKCKVLQSSLPGILPPSPSHRRLCEINSPHMRQLPSMQSNSWEKSTESKYPHRTLLTFYKLTLFTILFGYITLFTWNCVRLFIVYACKCLHSVCACVCVISSWWLCTCFHMRIVKLSWKVSSQLNLNRKLINMASNSDKIKMSRLLKLAKKFNCFYLSGKNKVINQQFSVVHC